MKYTQMPTDTFKQIQMNAGIMLSSFDPMSATVSNEAIMGATSGGFNFTAVPTFKDAGEGIDNCPKNMKELKKIETWEAKATGNFVTVTASSVAQLCAAADVQSDKITPRTDLKASDFKDIWIVGDYSDNNGAKNGGFIAVHMMNALSTGGFSMQTTDKDKGQFAFEFMAHYSMGSQDKVPFEIYLKAGTTEGMGK